jgi:ribosome-binding factor A
MKQEMYVWHYDDHKIVLSYGTDFDVSDKVCLSYDIEHVTHDLNNAAGFFRSLLSQRVEMRHTPELKFIYDESIAYGEKIEKIISDLHENE